jgi:ferritin-like protein
MNDLYNISACLPAYLPDNPRDVNARLQGLVTAERCATAGYTHVCNLTAGKDHRMHDLSLALLHEEVEHEAWFSEFLGEAPSAIFRRPGEGSERNSP